MTKDELWKIYTDKNPQFLTDGATFTAGGLKKFFDTTFDQAHDQGVRNGKAIEAMKPKDSSFGDMFGGLFGKP